MKKLLFLVLVITMSCRPVVDPPPPPPPSPTLYYNADFFWNEGAMELFGNEWWTGGLGDVTDIVINGCGLLSSTSTSGFVDNSDILDLWFANDTITLSIQRVSEPGSLVIADVVGNQPLLYQFRVINIQGYRGQWAHGTGIWSIKAIN